MLQAFLTKMLKNFLYYACISYSYMLSSFIDLQYYAQNHAGIIGWSLLIGNRNLLGLIVGCNKQKLLLLYIYSLVNCFTVN